MKAVTQALQPARKEIIELIPGAMMLLLIAVGVHVLRALHMPAQGSQLMLTCRAMLFWILLL
jgi:hypothetical protein